VRYLDQRRMLASPHPVTPGDYSRLPMSEVTLGRSLRALAARRRGLVAAYRPSAAGAGGRRLPVRVPVPLRNVPPDPSMRERVAAYTGVIGRVGFAAGLQVRIVDRLGLADPIASRVRLGDARSSYAGHEKDLPLAWFLARFADRRALRADPRLAADHRVRDARAALRCGPLRRLLDATTGALTVHRFLGNVASAWALTAVRFDRDPRAARERTCSYPARRPPVEP
jgi:hypothetical protein